MKQIMRLCISLLLMLCTIQTNAMTTSGNQIIDSAGNPIQLKGVSWFGFNTQTTMVDGLWGGDPLAYDFATAVYRMKLLGFNAVRLPFSFKDIFNIPPRTFSQPCTIPSQGDIQASVTNPSEPPPPGSTIPPMPAPPPRQPGMCNDYIPNDSTLNRFLWTINFFAKNGFYVLIDNHLREDQTVLEDAQKWVKQWVDLVTLITKDPVSKNMVMIDVLNEPDNFGIRWEASGGKPGLKDLYLMAMDAMYPVDNTLLFFLEGTGQGGIGANWGDGFATDPQLIAQNGLSDPNPFFQALLKKPYVNQVVISPHVYPPSVTGASSNYSGPGLWNRLSSSFGYLTKKGYCDATGACKVFPVAIGEFGSRFVEPRDLEMLSDFAAYLNNEAGAADGKHLEIPNWFFWAWNANSGDTGGIVEDNWKDIVWKKVDYLTTIDLKPWYLENFTPTYGTLCVSVNPADGLSKSDLKPITAGAYSFTVTDFNSPVCQTVQTGNYSVSAPPLVVGNKQYVAAAQTVTVNENETSSVQITYKVSTVPTSTISVGVQLGTPWQSAPGIFSNVVNLYLKNTGKEPVAFPWTLVLANSSYKGVSSYWNVLQPVVKLDGSITAKPDKMNTWENLQPNGANTVNVGMVISGTSQNFMPRIVKINGITATLTVVK